MWEILSSTTGKHIGFARTKQGACTYVFAGYCVAFNPLDHMLLALSRTDGRIITHHI